MPLLTFGPYIPERASIYFVQRCAMQYGALKSVGSPPDKRRERFGLLPWRLTMKAKELILRCYAEPDEDGSWFAICIDLNLYARGDSFDQAKIKLNGIIHEYVVEAFTVDANYFSDLIPRRAPLFFRVRYRTIEFLVSCIGAAHWLKSRLFESHLPLVPAA